MNNKTEWQRNAFIPDSWRLQAGEYTMEVYREDGERAYRVNGFKGKEQFVIAKPVSPNLGVTKRMAKKWLDRHIANTFTQPAPDAEQVQALNLATELERLQEMEQRLKKLYDDTVFWGNKPLAKILERLLYGEDAPNG